MPLNVLYATGFEAGLMSFYWTGGWSYFSDQPAMNSNAAYLHRTLAGYGGNYSVYSWSGTSSWRSPQVATSARWFNGWVYWNTNNLQISFVDNTGTYQACILFLQSSGVVQFVADGVGKANSAPGIVAPGDRVWLSVYYLPDPTNGVCKVYINGTNVINFTGDTTTSGANNWTSVLFGSFTAPITGIIPYGNFQAYLDDFSITDDDSGTVTTPPYPESYSVAVVPDVNAITGLTPFGNPNNSDNVNGIPAQQANYNYALASGDEDLYDLGAVVNAPNAVYAVSVFAQAARDGAITKAEVSVKSGASTDYGTPFVLPASPAYDVVSRHFRYDPNGGGAWTVPAVDALQVGIRFTT